MLPEEVTRHIDPILDLAYRDSERERNNDVVAVNTEHERHGRLKSSTHRAAVFSAFEKDLERRGRAIAEALRRVLSLGMLGDSDAIGGTLSMAFQERFDQQKGQVEEKLPQTPGLQGLSLQETADRFAAAMCGELQLTAREYVLRVRPPLPVLDLLPEQEELLTGAVEASRAVPSKDKTAFLVSQDIAHPSAALIHPGLRGTTRRAYRGDIQELGSKGLLNIESAEGRLAFDVRPAGFRYYEALRRRQGAGVERIEAVLKQLVSSERLRDLCPEAYERWSQAEAQLWRTDVEVHLTTIGHVLRESLQAFATALVNRHGPPEVDRNPAHDQARIKAVLAAKKDGLGKATHEVLDAQYATVSNLVQRLEHGAQREKESLTWEDSRRAVFLVAMAMLEIDRAVR